MLHVHSFHSPVGILRITETDGAVTGLCLNETASANTKGPATPLLLEVERQLAAYFAGKLRQFDLPLVPAGTAFRQKVWQALLEIPYGQMRSYKQIAEAVGNPLGFRAVGGANHANPIMILIPCHRVIAADGTLGGYGGGLAMKQTLLRLEGAL